MTAPDTDRLREIAADLLARLSESWSSMGWVAAPKIARILKERQEAAKTISALLADNARLLGEVERTVRSDRAGLRDRLERALAAEGIALEIGSREFYALEAAFNGRVADEWKARAQAAEAALERAREGLEPFARVAAVDIGETEADEDTFRNADRTYAKAPPITVGDARRAAEVYASLNHAGGGEKP